MKNLRLIILLIFIAVSPLLAIVGDWKSFGSKITIRDLYSHGRFIKAASHGGPIIFDTDKNEFLTNDIEDELAHIDIETYYVNQDGSEWYSYASGIGGITCQNANGSINYFDLGFENANMFSGDSNNVFVIYKPELSPQIAHFVKYNQNYIYHDTYNQFPGDPSEIYDIEIIGDSLFLAAESGLLKAWTGNSNLKPQSAWSFVTIDTSGIPIVLGKNNEILYWADERNDIYLIENQEIEKLISFEGAPLTFLDKGSDLSFVSTDGIYDLNGGAKLFTANTQITGVLYRGDTLWVSEYGKGLCRASVSGITGASFIPNTMNDLTANSLAIDDEGKVYVSGLEGVAILDGETWHNLTYSPYLEAIHNDQHTDKYSADTLNIAYHSGSGERLIYDAMISTGGKLYSSVTHTRITPITGQSAEARGPGALYEIDLNDYSQYEAYDTSNNMFEGTQGLGGSNSYLIMGGIAEDNYNNIYVLNRHTLQAETLVRLSPSGTIRRYSKENSNNTLQVLAREMAVDKYGRIWIANQARQEDIPRTDGGITVYDPLSARWALINTSDGLVSNDVYSLDVDPLTGNIWAATAEGVQMIYVPSSFNSSTEFTMNPEISGLENMVPVKIRIDAKGNKWIITQSQGIQIYMSNNRFYKEGAGLKTSNSGILDDIVFDVVFDSKNGYAYLLTASGLSRYEIAWTEEREQMDEVIVFPQPFKPGIDPYIAFDGLAEQSHVRITTIDGRVLHSFDSDSDENFEKQVVWDGRLPNGSYIPRGVYLAFITNIDGLKASVKFAVE